MYEYQYGIKQNNKLITYGDLSVLVGDRPQRGDNNVVKTVLKCSVELIVQQHSHKVVGTFKVHTFKNKNWRRHHVNLHYNQKELRRILSQVELPFFEDHFPRGPESDDSPDIIRFFKSEEDGEVNRLTEMKIGKYLHKYFKSTMNGTEIGDMAARWAAEFGPPEMKFTTDGDDVMRVYQDGPNSCMSGHHDESNHPSGLRIYADGDLSIAYIERGNKIVARAVCCQELKIYINCIYGDSLRFRKAAEIIGFKSAEEDDFIGLSFPRIKNPHQPNIPQRNYILPYMDIYNQLDIREKKITFI